jgi:hypothetical protein
MEVPQTGGCQCGAVRYQIAQAPSLVYTCHCTNCQHLTGSAFSMAVCLPAEAFCLTGIELRPFLFRRSSESEGMAARWLCPDCGSWICSGPKPGSAPPGTLRFVRVGTLDDTSWVRPTVHFWTRSAQLWILLPEGGRRFETQPADLLNWFVQNS